MPVCTGQQNAVGSAALDVPVLWPLVFFKPYLKDMVSFLHTCNGLVKQISSFSQKIWFYPFSSIRTYISPPFWILGADTLPSICCIHFPDHVNGHCTSPTSQSCSSGKRLSSADVSRANRRGPGRPPFRKAQSAACMEISLPVTTEGGWQWLFCQVFVNFSPGVKGNKFSRILVSVELANNLNCDR